jgi:K(+)-stimulated pyrophosphate-energized sodium pump
VGSAAGLLVALATEYHTAARPLRKVADAARDGAAATLMLGAAAGLESVVLPALLVGAAVWGTTSLAGLYGLGLGAVGMLATVGVTQTIAAYGAITDNASALGTLAGLPRDARATSDSLGAVGNTTAAVGKGVAGAASVLTGLALMGAVSLASGATLTGPRAPGPFVLAGLLLGAMLPFLVAALTLGGVLRAVGRARRADEGATGPSDDAACLDRIGRSALRETAGPALLALVTPPLVGWLAGASGLVGLLLGAAISGGPLALFLANSGGVWDNAARFIAGGAHGGRGSPAHQAAVVAETLGDPFKDSCAPAVGTLIKLMAVLALVLAPWLAGL